MKKPHHYFSLFAIGIAFSVSLLLFIILFTFSYLLINEFTVNPISYFVFFAMFLLIIVSVFGSWLFVVIRLPYDLSRRFDLIKNKIASGEISNVQGFSIELARFIMEIFSYPGLNAKCVIIKVKDTVPEIEPEHHRLISFPINDWELLSKNTKAIVIADKIILENRKHIAYLVPIWFLDEWLGYFVVCTRAKINIVFKYYLNILEEYYMDDQIKILMKLQA